MRVLEDEFEVRVNSAPFASTVHVLLEARERYQVSHGNEISSTVPVGVEK